MILSSKKFLFILVISLFLLISFFYKDNIFQTKFVDEEYNFAIGRYLTSREILYEDIITNHQPLTHIFSSIVQNTTHPNSTFSLISKHRWTILMWSLVWSLVLVYFFGLSVLIFIIPFELTKSCLFGNLFLAESFLIYPLIFLVGTIFKNKYNNFHLFIAGLATGSGIFLWGPAWPLLGFLTLILFLKQQKNFRLFLFFCLGFLIVTLFVANFTSVLGYLYYYLYTNLTYTVPNYHATYYKEPFIFTIIKSFLTPFLAIFSKNNTSTLWIIRLFLIIIFVNLIPLIKQKRFKEIILIFTILGLLNLRFVNPGSEYFAAGFLPWYASFIFIGSLLIKKTFEEKRYRKIKLLNMVLIVVTLVVSIKFSYPGLLEKSSPLIDYQINYSTHSEVGTIIKLMRDEADTLFVSNDSWLVYWQSDTNHVPKLFGYYTWMAGISDLNKKVLDTFENNPPTFFYCDNCKDNDLKKYLIKYTDLKQNGNSINLFVLPEKINRLNQSQIDQLKSYNIEPKN